MTQLHLPCHTASSPPPGHLYSTLSRYSASVLKPWYPAFDDSTLRSIFAATCLTTAAQEVLLRGYVAAVLTLWWASVLNDARGPEDALFWVSGCEPGTHPHAPALALADC